MKTVYTKRELGKLEDRFENEFALSFETNEMPEQITEIENFPYPAIRNQLLDEHYSLIVCLPHLPVVKALKKAEVLQTNHSFKLLRISAEQYNEAIEEFLKEAEYQITFFWIRHFYEVLCDLPKTSQERIKLSNLENNQLYSFGIEIDTCTVVSWS